MWVINYELAAKRDLETWVNHKVITALIASQHTECTNITMRAVLPIEDTAVLHRFNRTNLKRKNQRCRNYNLWDWVLQIADQYLCVKLLSFQ